MNHVQRNVHLMALGSNATEDISSCVLLLKEALQRIKAAGAGAPRSGSIWRTPAYPAGAGPDFANACAVLENDLSPRAMLDLLHKVEAAMGRIRRERWGQRVIDLDLLATDGQVLPDRDTVSRWMALPPEDQRRLAPDGLVLPHPRLHERGFVLVPLAEVAPDWCHPLTGKSVRAMLAALDPAETAAISRL